MSIETAFSPSRGEGCTESPRSRGVTTCSQLEGLIQALPLAHSHDVSRAGYGLGCRFRWIRVVLVSSGSVRLQVR